MFNVELLKAFQSSDVFVDLDPHIQQSFVS